MKSHEIYLLLQLNIYLNKLIVESKRYLHAYHLTGPNSNQSRSSLQEEKGLTHDLLVYFQVNFSLLLTSTISFLTLRKLLKTSLEVCSSCVVTGCSECLLLFLKLW